MEFLILLILILFNGFLAMSELAVVSSRRARLQHLSEEGSQGAQAALELAQSPGRFLSTVQVGITLIGVLSGAFGSAALADDLSRQVEKISALEPYSQTISLAVIVTITTYLSLIIGELVPKQLAIQNPEKAAALVAPSMKSLSAVAAPVVSLLSVSSEFVLWLLGRSGQQEHSITEAEVLALIEQGTKVGVFETTEQEMIEGVLGLADQRVTELMTFRTEIIWLDTESSYEDIQTRIIENPFHFYPVCKGSIENVQGVVEAKDLLVHILSQVPFDLKSLIRQPIFVPESTRVAKVLDMFKAAHCEAALVIGEFGNIEGFVTIDDLVGEVFGEVDATEEPDIIQREDGSWLLDGMLPINELEEVLPDVEFPEAEEGVYLTLAGFVLHQLGRIPSSAEYFDWAGMRFEVMDMDGNRVDKVLVRQIPPANISSAESHAAPTQDD